MNFKNIIIFFAFVALLPSMSQAQQLGETLGESDEPVEISADNSLEWLQKENQYVANGKVEVTQGTSKIFSNKLVADYRENEETGNTEIWQLTAYDNVRLENEESTATADKAVYNVDTGLSVLTGNNLQLTLPDQVITARERMEYNLNKGIAKAVGNAKIKRDTDTLEASTITAFFEKDKTGKQALKQAKANGGVTIKTTDETIIGNSGVYHADKNTAEVTGDVKVTRGPNILEGARAEVNLTTNISKMFGSPTSGKRVTGVFFPSSKPKRKTPKETKE